MSAPRQGPPFAKHWPAYAQRQRAHLAAPHYRAARAILSCRTAAKGMVRRVCAGCGAVQVSPLSCGHRACPQCSTAQARQWEERRTAKLLPVPHFLVTLTVPEELRPLLRGKTGYDAMFRASAVALRASVGTHLGGEPGWTSVLHTWTRQLAAHPHLHLIVAGCVVSKEGALREVRRRDYLVPHALLAARWRHALRAALQAAAATDSTLAARLAALPAETWTRRWVVDLQPVGSGQKALGYLARYVQKTALDAARLVRFDAASVTIAWRERPKHPGDRRGLMAPAGATLRAALRAVYLAPLGWPGRRASLPTSSCAASCSTCCPAASSVSAMAGSTAPPRARSIAASPRSSATRRRPPPSPGKCTVRTAAKSSKSKAFASTLRCCPSGNAARWPSHSVRLRRPRDDHSAPGQTRAGAFVNVRGSRHPRTRAIAAWLCKPWRPPCPARLCLALSSGRANAPDCSRSPKPPPSDASRHPLRPSPAPLAVLSRSPCGFASPSSAVYASPETKQFTVLSTSHRPSRFTDRFNQ